MSSTLADSISAPLNTYVLHPLDQASSSAAVFWDEVGCAVERWTCSKADPRIARIARFAFEGLPVALAIHLLPSTLGLIFAAGLAFTAQKMPDGQQGSPSNKTKTALYSGLACSDAWRVTMAALEVLINPAWGGVKLAIFGALFCNFSHKAYKASQTAW